MVTNAMLVYSTVSETLMYYHYKTHNLLENETSFRARALPITLLYFWSIDVRELLTCGARDISDIIDARGWNQLLELAFVPSSPHQSRHRHVSKMTRCYWAQRRNVDPVSGREYLAALFGSSLMDSSFWSVFDFVTKT